MHIRIKMIKFYYSIFSLFLKYFLMIEAQVSLSVVELNWQIMIFN